MIETDLLHNLLRMYPAQPATAIWRAVEIGALFRFGVPEGRGLDLGCGDGKLTGVILEWAGPRRLVGVDPDPFETKAAYKTGHYEAVHTASGDAIPELDGSFDFVISNSVLEHIPDVKPVLTEVARLLRPGGRFLFTVPGPGFHANLRGSLLPWVSRSRYLADLDKRLLHLRYPSEEQWQMLCSAAKLRLEGCPGYLSRDETRAWEMVSGLTGGLLYTLRGKQKLPIAIQKELGLRQLQNKVRMPSIVAKVIGKVIRKMAGSDHNKWIPENKASCLLLHGIRL